MFEDVSIGVWITLAIISTLQIIFCTYTVNRLIITSKFFKKRKDFAVIGSGEECYLSIDVTKEDSDLSKLLKEINDYTKKNRGTTDFSIIQNKTERKLMLRYEEALSKISFPIYLGLMGTFLGVGLGLYAFNSEISYGNDGVTDKAIAGLIHGVLVSMTTSFVGLFLTTGSNFYASYVKKNIDKEKDKFYDFIQVELMPTLGVSMVSALNKLHETITIFEPSFNRVIDRFQETFDRCTNNFGTAFEKNVKVVSDAVRIMGKNMDKINQNVDLNEQMIRTMQSRNMQRTLQAFIEATKGYELVTECSKKFEEIVTNLHLQTTALIETQRQYNESLSTPLVIANRLNDILNRVSDFEASINVLGRDIAQTDLLGNTQIEALRAIITQIRSKQEVAYHALETSDGELKNIFELQAKSIKRLGEIFEESFEEYVQKFQNMLKNLETQILERRREIIQTLEEKFSLEQIQNDFSKLSFLSQLEKLDQLEKLSLLEKLGLLENLQELSNIDNHLSEIQSDSNNKKIKDSTSTIQNEIVRTNMLLSDLGSYIRSLYSSEEKSKKWWPFK